jgi:hypothetical protein
MNREDKLIAWIANTLNELVAPVVSPDFIHHLIDTDFQCECKIEQPEWDDYPSIDYCVVYQAREAEFQVREEQQFREQHDGMSRTEWNQRIAHEMGLIYLRRNAEYAEAEEKGLLP